LDTNSLQTARLTLIGGPTLLIEVAGLRLLTDPTFDPPQTYQMGEVSYSKFSSPALTADSLLPVDAVLLSHDQHMDNLDRGGREFLPRANRVLTTVSGARRLAGNSTGLAPWSALDLPLPDGRSLTVTSVPARHGPVGIEPITGDVIGFVLSIPGQRDIYISGDTVWFQDLDQLGEQFDIGLAVLFTGSAQPRGPFNVTMSTNDAIEAASRLPGANIVAVHNAGWSHFRQSQDDLQIAFRAVGINRLTLLEPGVSTEVSLA
jgi:L-ascorbate metabolism protein UlaG (beta-lactamase superfamily)